MKNTINAHLHAIAECIPTKSSAKHRASWKTVAVMNKRDKVKAVSLCNKRNQTNANAYKHKKTQRELTHAKQNKKNTFPGRSIK